MLMFFEVYLTSEDHAATLLSPETIAETQAQILTKDEAVKIGVLGLPENPPHPMRLVISAAKDLNFISSKLEANENVVAFRAHQIDV